MPSAHPPVTFFSRPEAAEAATPPVRGAHAPGGASVVRSATAAEPRAMRSAPASVTSRPWHDRKACRAVVLPGDWDPSSYPHPMCRAHDSPSRQIGPLHEQQRKPGKRASTCSRNTERHRLTCAGGCLCNNRVNHPGPSNGTGPTQHRGRGGETRHRSGQGPQVRAVEYRGDVRRR